MRITCPHCGKDIDLVGAKELTEEYDLGPNAVTYARNRGRFPEPILSFGNRNLFLRAQIDEWTRTRKASKASETAEYLSQLLSELPEDQREAIRERLSAELGIKR